ncbi:MAG: L-lactate permease [Acidobacteria bacterium]|nr:MAG: L-lactate permease [Acidobacteriota bacterium]
MHWSQTYAPLGHIFSSALVAAIPIVVLLGLLAFMHVRAHFAALAGLFSALVIAVFVFGMPPALAGAASIYGAGFGLFPIGWIVLNAIFIYDISVKTGHFETVKHSIAGLAADRRLQLLLIAFSFGAFIEGAAGFGTPVAISGAMLIGLGFRPLQAAGLALIGNTAPVAFGALGTPIITLNAVTGLPLDQLSAMVGRQLPFFSVIVPFWLVAAMAGWRGMREVWPACLTVGISFATTQFLVSNYHGPWVVDIAGALVSMAAQVILLRFWRPRTVWRFPHDADGEPLDQRSAGTPAPSGRDVLLAWSPWILLSIFVFAWGIPQYKKVLDGLSVVKFAVPYLDGAILRVPPVVPVPEPERALFTFNWLSATGTGLFVAGLFSGLFLRLRPLELLALYGRTLWRVRLSLLTIAAMLALGFTTRYSGLDTTMGLAFAATGVLFPFFSPLLGWLGVALTGSDTSSNVLFGNLQKVSAEQLGIPPVLTAAANASGGVMGKMIDAQSIVVASVATGGGASAGDILRYVFLHSLVLAILVGVLVLLQAYVFTGMIP